MFVPSPGGIVDSHMHMWRWADLRTRWVPPDPLARDFLPSRYVASAIRAGVVSSILVEAGASLRELHALRSRADADGHVVGTVASLDLSAQDVRVQIERLATSPGVSAARMNAESHPDRGVLHLASVKDALGAVADAGLAFEFLVIGEQLPHVRALLDGCPGLSATIEHLGKPRLGDASAVRAWRHDMAGLAAGSAATCKLSFGFRADSLDAIAASHQGWPLEQLEPVVEWLLETFGPTRLMWGSDWPLSSLLGSYDDCVAAWQTLLRSLSANDLQLIFAQNASVFYGLEHRGQWDPRG